MTQIGIPIEELGERVGKNGAVIREWPFADLIPTTEIVTNIGYGWRATDGTAVGRVLFAHDKAVTLGVHEKDYRTGDSKIHLLFDDPKLAQPWRQLVGTTLAAEVEVLHNNSGYAYTLNFRPRNILAIEPPMTHPGHKDAVRLTPRTGYVHGVVTDIPDVFADTLELASPDTDGPITLHCITPPDLHTPAGLSSGTIQPGDVIRADINRKSDMRERLYIATGPIHHLGRLAV